MTGTGGGATWRGAPVSSPISPARACGRCGTTHEVGLLQIKRLTALGFSLTQIAEIGDADGSGGADVLAHVGTRDAARDMDVLRAVHGDEQLSYLGQSYGTRLGTVCAELFPRT